MTPVTRSVVVAARITNGAGARSVAMAPTAAVTTASVSQASNVTNYGPWLGTLTPKDALVGPHKIEAQEQIRGDMALCFVWAVSLPHASSQSRLPACRASNGYCRYAHWRLPSSRCRAGFWRWRAPGVGCPRGSESTACEGVAFVVRFETEARAAGLTRPRFRRRLPPPPPTVSARTSTGTSP